MSTSLSCPLFPQLLKTLPTQTGTVRSVWSRRKGEKFLKKSKAAIGHQTCLRLLSLNGKKCNARQKSVISCERGEVALGRGAEHSPNRSVVPSTFQGQRLTVCMFWNGREREKGRGRLWIKIVSKVRQMTILPARRRDTKCI